MRTTFNALAVALLLTACGGADKEEIYRAREFMQQLCEIESGDHVGFDGMTLYKASKPFKPVPAGTMIAVKADGIAVDGKLITTTEQVLAQPNTAGHLGPIVTSMYRYAILIPTPEQSITVMHWYYMFIVFQAPSVVALPHSPSFRLLRGQSAS